MCNQNRNYYAIRRIKPMSMDILSYFPDEMLKVNEEDKIFPLRNFVYMRDFVMY